MLQGFNYLYKERNDWYSYFPTSTFILKQFKFDLVVLLFGAVRLLKFDQIVQRYYYSGGTFIKIWPISLAVLLFGWYHYSVLESTLALVAILVMVTL